MRFAFCGALAFAVLVPTGAAEAASRTLDLYFTHTKEKKRFTYKRNGKYDQRVLKELNRFLRDWRRNESTRMDPELFDLLWEVQQEFGGKTISVVSAYRSPATNSMLRKRSRGVARNSQHMAGKAIDFYIKGADISKVRREGMKRQVGGVGYYPRSGSPFVHFDTGRVRSWPRMSRTQLARLFPDGETLHLPSNGKPLSGYKRAQAREKEGKLASLRGGRGGGLFGISLGRGRGRDVAEANREQEKPAQVRTAALSTTAAPARRTRQPEADADAPARVRTQAASLGPTATGAEDGEEGRRGFLRSLPSVSLGGLISRNRRGEEDATGGAVDTVPPPSDPLRAVAAAAALPGVETIQEAASEAAIASVPPPLPRRSPRGEREAQPAEAEAHGADGEADGVDREDASPVGALIAMLPPDRPADSARPGNDAGALVGDDGAPADDNPQVAALQRLGYATDGSDDVGALATASVQSATAALIPRAAITDPFAEVDRLEGVGGFAAARGASALSPVRGATPLLVADSRAIDAAPFADLAPTDGEAALAGLMHGEPISTAQEGFGNATGWLSTERFTGLRITVYNDPRS